MEGSYVQPNGEENLEDTSLSEGAGNDHQEDEKQEFVASLRAPNSNSFRGGATGNRSPDKSLNQPLVRIDKNVKSQIVLRNQQSQLSH